MQYGIVGRHYIADFYGVCKQLLTNKDFLTDRLIDAAEEAGATVLEWVGYEFHPNGVTVAVVLSESHITCHSYPYQQFIAIDCYTCGEKANPEIAINYLSQVLQPKYVDIKVENRGIRDFSQYLDEPMEV